MKAGTKVHAPTKKICIRWIYDGCVFLFLLYYEYKITLRIAERMLTYGKKNYGQSNVGR